MGKDVQISLDVEIEKKASWTRVTNVMKKLVAEQEVWDKSLRAMAAQKLTTQANEWLADNDQTDRDPEKDPITGDEFARRILLTEFTVSPGGRFTAWYEVTNVMKKLVAEQEVWDKSLRAMAAQKLTTQANEWLADNDQTDRDPEKDPITGDEFARRILLTEFTVSPGGRFTAWYEDDDMFWGHMVTVDGTLKKGPIGADIQG